MKTIHEDVKKIQYVEVLRFLAALAVVFVHLPISLNGHYGVDLFFIISGFIMMYSTRKTCINFFKKRIIRVVPLYWALTIGVFIIALYFPSFLQNTTNNFIHFIKSLFFIPFDKNGIGHFPVLFLGWTLNYEMYFYLIFGIFSYVNIEKRDILTSFFIVVIIFLFENSNNFILSVYSKTIVVEFILGMILYRILYIKKFDFHLFILVLLACLPMILCSSERLLEKGLPMFVCFIVAHFLLSKKRIPNYLVSLGGCTYSLYLIHPYIIRGINKIQPALGLSTIEYIIWCFFTITLCIITSFYIYKLLERPINNFFRSFLKKVK